MLRQRMWRLTRRWRMKRRGVRCPVEVQLEFHGLLKGEIFGILDLPCKVCAPIGRCSILMHLFSHSRWIHGKTGRLAVVFVFGLLMPVPSAQAQEGLAQAELAKRKVMVEEARELIHKGEEAMQAGRPDQAVEAFEGARNLLPMDPALAEVRAKAIAGYVDAAVAQADILSKAGDLVAAKKLIDRVLADDVAPDAPSALKMKQQLNDPIRHNPAQSPEHSENVRKVVDLIQMANGAVQLGLYDKAKGSYEEILRIDPYNKFARHGLENLVRLKREADQAAYDQNRAEMINEVARAWETELEPEARKFPELADRDATKPGNEVTVSAKLNNIIIPSIALDQVSLREAIDYLRVVSSREDTLARDQNSRGINFTINLGSPDNEVVQRIENMRFDLKLTKVPVIQALKYINQLTRTSYSVDEFAVIIRPAGQVTDELMTRNYRVPPDFIGSLSEGASSQGANDNPFEQTAKSPGLLTKRLSIQELLRQKGVRFPEGAMASYSASTNLLRVTNTALNLDIIEQIVENLKQEDPVMVSVQVTMIKTQQKNLKELGYDWLLTPVNLGQGVNLGGGTPGNAMGRTGEDFSQTIPLPADVVLSGLVTNGLRSGDGAFIANSIDDLIANPSREAQTKRVAPGILSLSGIFSDGKAQVMMRGLNQATGIDTMARPAIVTRSGESAKVLLARQFIYPSEYDPPELQSGGSSRNTGDAFPVIPANPTAFETRDVGITLEVLPVADAQKNYVNITLNPSIVEFDGFVNFGSPISTTVNNAFGGFSRVTLTENQILMPVFSTKRAATHLTVADGATVVFGGLLSERIQKVEDKVPVLGDVPLLGRFFRSSSNLPVSTAIIFMVRVELMDPTGRRFREAPKSP